MISYIQHSTHHQRVVLYSASEINLVLVHWWLIIIVDFSVVKLNESCCLICTGNMWVLFLIVKNYRYWLKMSYTIFFSRIFSTCLLLSSVLLLFGLTNSFFLWSCVLFFRLLVVMILWEGIIGRYEYYFTIGIGMNNYHLANDVTLIKWKIYGCWKTFK